jgi:hypothetical protein
MDSELKRQLDSFPASAHSKRCCKERDDGTETDSDIKLSLMCLICRGLVVDAVQTPC